MKLDAAIGILDSGGFVRFTWSKCLSEVIDSNGVAYSFDGRSYQAFLKRPNLQRTETGSVETKDLIITWHLIQD
jgi:hypothetical protein